MQRKLALEIAVNILVIIYSLRGGGAERVVSRLTREWAKAHRVGVALFDGSVQHYDHGGRVLDLSCPSSDNLIAKIYNFGIRTIKLARLFRRERPDRIFSYQESANYPAVVAAALTGRLDRLWVSVRYDPVRLSRAYRGYAALALLYRLPARVVAASAGIKGALERMGVPAGKTVVIPNPAAAATAAGRPLGYRLPSPFILGAGRLDPQKGFDRLLAAFASLDRRDIHLVIAGDGAERAELARLARTLGVEDRTHFPGRVADIDAWYRNAACFVLSSRSEGWPNVLGEAMAHGCPVVAFDCDYGPSEIIEDGESGLLVPEGDVAALASATGRVLSDRGLREHLANGGRKRAATFSVEDIAARWLEG